MRHFENTVEWLLKLDFMFKRISSKEARQWAQPMYGEACKHLEEV